MTVKKMSKILTFILVLAMVSLLGPSVWNIIWVIGGLGWASVARLVYSGTLSTKQTGYVEASRALGATLFGAEGGLIEVADTKNEGENGDV